MALGDTLYRDQVLSALPTLDDDSTANNEAWDAFLEHEASVLASLDAARRALQSRRDELGILARVQIIDGEPVYAVSDRIGDTYQSYPARKGDPVRYAHVSWSLASEYGPARPKLVISVVGDPVRHFYHPQSDNPAVQSVHPEVLRARALDWVIRALMPTWPQTDRSGKVLEDSSPSL